jgi:hypothetical protein
MFDPGIALQQGISAVVGTARHAVGDRIVYGNATYAYAYNSDTTEIPIGANLVHDTGVTGYSMVLSGATNVAYLGMVEHVTVPTANYFWMLVQGVSNNATNSAVTWAPGVALYAAAGGGLTSTAPTGLATALGTNNNLIGAVAIAMGTAAGSTTIGGAQVHYLLK